MQINVALPGIETLFKNFGAKPEKLKAAMSRIIAGAALIIEGGAKKRTPVLTGRLRASITSDIKTDHAIVSPHTNYALFVHEGTKRMKPRPFMKWGVQDTTKNLRSFVLKEVRQALKN